MLLNVPIFFHLERSKLLNEESLATSAIRSVQAFVRRVKRQKFGRNFVPSSEAGRCPSRDLCEPEAGTRFKHSFYSSNQPLYDATPQLAEAVESGTQLYPFKVHCAFVSQSTVDATGPLSRRSCFYTQVYLYPFSPKSVLCCPILCMQHITSAFEQSNL